MYLCRIRQLVNSVFLGLCILVMSACSTSTKTIASTDINTKSARSKPTPVIIKPPTVPSWYTKTIDLDQNYLYGFGSGSSLDNATINALAYITNSLGTTVSSQTTFSTSLNNDTISKSINEHIQTSSNQIILSDYKTLQTSQSRGTFFVLLEINKQELINKLKDNIRTKSQNNNLRTNQTTMYNFRKSLKLYNDLGYIRNAITTLELIDKKFDKKLYLTMYNNTQQTFDSTSENIKIYIDTSHKSFFYEPLQKFLQQRFTIVKNQNNATTKLQIFNNSFDEAIIKPNQYNIKTSITVSIEDIYANTTLNKEYNIKSTSAYGRQAAIDKAKLDFLEQLNQTTNIKS